MSSIFTHTPSLIPDASELITTFLEGETDPTCKRNAFAALASIDHDAALVYLSSVFEGIPNSEELLQLVELEFIRKDAVQDTFTTATSTVGEVVGIVTHAVGDVVKALGGFATEVFEIRDAARRAAADSEREAE